MDLCCQNYTDKPGYERLLPGDGTIDYVDYYRRLMKFGWTGHTVVEISAQIHSRPGYDPVAATMHSYARIRAYYVEGGVCSVRSTDNLIRPSIR
jgi:sugar phosphate isomerase/epimerase